MAPSNALCIVQSEISLLSTALRCHTRIVFRGHQDELRSPLYKSFLQLKSILNGVSSLNEIEPLVYLTPFLEVIRSEDTTGPITGLALTAVDKFLSYGLLELPDPDYADAPLSGPGSRKSVAMAAEAIADSGTQARFVGTERSSDEVVLMKVLHLLRTLLLVPAGSLVSDRVVREILQSCFRICFEPKLSELLRRTAELCLASIIQLFFSRLPSLIATSLYQQQIENGMKFGEPSSGVDESSVHTAVEPNTVCALSWQSDHTGVTVDQEPKTATVEAKPHPGPVPLNSLCTTAVINGHLSTEDLGDEITALSPEPNTSTPSCHTQEAALDDGSDKQGPSNDETCLKALDSETFAKETKPSVTYIASATDAVTDAATTGQYKKTKADGQKDSDTSIAQPQPYGLPAVHDLLHYLISLLTPERNADGIISVSLGLVTIALETGADAISNCPSLLQLVQGDLTKHLLLLLYSDRVWQFAATLRVCFMLFESMRKHLKLQMEVYLQRLTAICSSDNESTSYERREVALDSVVRLFLVPGLATELYVNYDCDPYCSNLFEDIAKMLAKNAYPVDRLMGTHLLALDALLAVLNTIGTQCVTLTPSGTRESSDSNNSRGTTDALRHVRTRLNRHPTDKSRLPSREQLTAAKETKKILILGSEQFNSKPKRGIEFLQHYRVLRSPLDPTELAHFLRENPRLDKRMIGEYLSDRKNGEVLGAYVRQFNFKGVQIDEALRVYLEAFRLPGEAPLIQRIMEHFAEHWYYANNEPFADVDSAFTLAYAILMLNTDQHNPNSKKQNAPMTALDFRKNLSGMNGTGDFDPKLLDAIYRNIHKNEIVMPSEQTGLVRENYLWKCLLRRAATNQADFIHVQTGALDPELFDIIWGPTVSALSFIFDKTLDPAVQIKAVDGFIRCAAIAAHHGMSDVLDNLVISLCKFTTLLTLGENPSTLSVSLGRNNKALLALRLVFALSANHADILRYGWHSLLDCLLQLFRASLLPDELVEAEDFVSPSRRVRLTTRGCAPVIDAKSRGGKGRGNAAGGSNREVSVFSSFYQYLTTGSAWTGSDDDDDADEEDLHDQYYEQSRQPHCLSAHRGDPDSIGASVEWPGRRLEQFSASYWASIGSAATSGSQLDDASATRVAVDTVAQCAIAQLIKDTKFLVDASLIELIKALLRAVRGDAYASLPAPNNASEEWHSHEDSNLGVSNRTAPSASASGIQAENGAFLGLDTLSDSTHSLSVGRSTPNDLTDRETNSPDPDAQSTLRKGITLPAPNPQSVSAAPLSTPTTSYYPTFFASGGGAMLTEECRIFCLELLVRVLLHNRDRMTTIWPNVQYYLADMLLTAPEPTPLVERVVVGFLRLATCLLRRHEMTSQIFSCLYYIMWTRGDQLLLDCSNQDTSVSLHKAGTVTTSRPSSVRSKDTSDHARNGVGLQIVAGLTDLLRNHAADLPDPSTDWQLLFGLLEVCGAGLRATPAARHPHHVSMQDITSTRTCPSDSGTSPDRGYTSDSEAAELTYNRRKPTVDNESSATEGVQSVDTAVFSPVRANSVNTWVMVDVGEPTDSSASPSCARPDVTSSLGGQKSIERPLKRSGQPHQLIPSSTLALPVYIGLRDAATLERASDCLAFLVRDPAHITPDNFQYCVVTLRVFVETCLRRHPKWVQNRVSLNPETSPHSSDKSAYGTAEVTTSPSSPRRAVRSTAKSPTQHSGTLHHHVHSDSDSDLDVDPHGRGAYRAQKSSWTREILLSPTTGVIAVQLLDLIHLLLTRATSIYTEWKYTGATCGSDFEAGTSDEPPNDEKQAAESVTVDANYLWPNCWRPLLQAIARLCCDCRREVRTDALSYLHRVLLSSVLHPLSGSQWEECFEQVLFPLLSGFLESIAVEEAAAVADNTRSPKAGRPRQASSVPYHAVEYADPRMRAIPLLTKVFLQHLRPLHKSENFHTLWTRMLVYMEQYMQASSSDSLTDAVRESLKNVLLVMYTGTHDTPPILMRDAPPNAPEAVLWDLTAKQLSSFLPELLDQLFPPPPVPTPAPAAAPLPFTSEFTSCPTLESTPVPTSHEQVSPHTTPAPSLVSQCAEAAIHSVLGHELPDHDSALPLPANAPFVVPVDCIVTAQPAQTGLFTAAHAPSGSLVDDPTNAVSSIRVTEFPVVRDL